MVRRSTSQFKIDDLAYPIRVKFKLPEGGLYRQGLDPDGWLKANLAHLAWAWGGGAASLGCNDATAYFFRRIDDAKRFMEAFPQLELADPIDTPVYNSPAKSAGPNPPRHQGWSCLGRGR